MILVKEITVWKGVTRQPNHTYICSDNMEYTYGYFKWNNPKDFMMFKNKLRLDTRYRKFETIKRGLKLAGQAEVKTKTVTGSKGNIYTITETASGLQCSCSGFKYRGKCKHVEVTE
jgi:hypothetical protein